MTLQSIRTLGLAALALAATLQLRAENKIPDECKQGGFTIGCQAYTFNRFSVFEAIEKTAEAGGKTIEFYPGQKLSKEEPKVTWDHFASEEVIAKVEAKLKQHGLRAVNYGVVGYRTKTETAETEWRKIFQFAKRLGLYGITTEDDGRLDIIEPLVKEFDIRVGIHEHGRRPRDASYKVWDPHYIAQLVEKRDQRIGACADTGHWQTSGLNPVYCLRVLKGRIISAHMKDKTDYGEGQHDVPYGGGVGEIGRCLDELKKQGFDGHISVEYEFNWDHSVTDVTKCIGFVRDHGK